MNQSTFSSLWLPDRNPDAPLGIYFTGLSVRLLHGSQNLHSMVVVQPDRNRQEIGYMTYARKAAFVGVKESWRGYDEDEDDG